MTTNIAELGFSVDSSQLRTAKTELQTLAPAARAAEQAAIGLTQSMQRTVGAASAVAVGTGRVTSALQSQNVAVSQSNTAFSMAQRSAQQLAQSMQQVASTAGGVVAGASSIAAGIQAQEAATVRAVHANGIYVDSAGRVRAAGSAFINVSGNVVSAAQLEQAAIGGTANALERSVQSYARATTAAGLYVDAHGRVRNAQGRFVASAEAVKAKAELAALANEQLAQSANVAANMQQNLNKVLNQGSKDVNIMHLNTANLAAQFQDVGVTAAMGMNPLMIGLQQGTQISMVLAQNGTTAAKAIEMLSAAFKSVISPLALGTIGIVALVAGLVQLVPWLKTVEYLLRATARGLLYLKDTLIFITQVVVAFTAVWAALNFGTVLAGFGAVIGIVWKLVLAVGALSMAFGPIGLAIVAVVGLFLYFRKEIAKILGPSLISAIKAPFNFIIGMAVAVGRAIWEIFSSMPAAFKMVANGFVQDFKTFLNTILDSASEVAKKLPWWLGGSAEGISFRFDDTKGIFAVEKKAWDLGKRVNDAVTQSMNIDYIGKIGKLAGDGIDYAAKKLNKWADALAKAEPKYQKLIRQAEKEISLLKVEQQGIGQTSLQYSILREQMELVAKAKEQDIKLTPAMIANLERLGTVIGTLKDQNEKLKDTFNFARDVVGGFVRDLRDGLKQGEGFLKAFANAALNILNKVSDRLIDMSLDMLFNTKGGGANKGMLGGLVDLFKPLFGINDVNTGSLNANLSGSMVKNAKGNVFGPGGLITRPTMFAFGKGGALGLAGEAGTEAVMPLKRGPDGSLGVVAHGASNDNGPRVVVQVINNAPDTAVREESTIASDGSEFRRIIIDTTRGAMANGEFDKVQRGRFGNIPNRVVR